MKVGAVRDYENHRIAVVFEFEDDEFKSIVSAAPLKYKKVLDQMFHKNIPPKKILGALYLAIKILRRRM